MSSSPPAQDPGTVLQSLTAAIEAKVDYFTLLQVPRNAEPMQIRDAYFRLAKQVHPDHPMWATNPALRAQATKAFQAITLANSTLADPVRRSGYVQMLLQALAERQGAVNTALQPTPRGTMPVMNLRPTGPQPHAIDDVTSPRQQSLQTPRGMPSGQGPSAPGSIGRPMVGNPLTTTGQFSRGTMSGQQPMVSAPGQVPGLGTTDRMQRPQQPMPTTPSGLPPAMMGQTGQFQRPISSGQATLGGQTIPGGQATLSSAMTSSTGMQQALQDPSRGSRPVSTRGLEPPPNIDVARIYLHSGRQQLNRRDWVGAQEALELALPLLETTEMADCKVMLGWAIFNNNGNPEHERIERPKAMWNEVATQFAKSPFHAQACYYLAIWHKLHGELRHVMSNLQTCLTLQPNHIEAAREKRLMEQRRSNLAEMQELEAKEKQLKARRASKTAVPVGRPTPAASATTNKKVALPKEQSWLEKLFGGDKK